MIKHRSREIAIGITLSIVVALMFFYAEDESLSLDSSITGMVSYDDYSASRDLVIVSGTEFKAVVQDNVFYYIFDGGEWFESKKEFVWEKRVDMGESMWSGLVYLESYNAMIYFRNEEVKDITKFMREFR